MDEKKKKRRKLRKKTERKRKHKYYGVLALKSKYMCACAWEKIASGEMSGNGQYVKMKSFPKTDAIATLRV